MDTRETAGSRFAEEGREHGTSNGIRGEAAPYQH